MKVENPTSRDIAELAGVSQATVSRAIRSASSRLWRAMAYRFVVAAVPGVLLSVASRYFAVDTKVGLVVAGIAYFTVYFSVCGALRLITIADIKSLFGRK